MAKAKHVPMRQCVACRHGRPKRELVRVVRAAGGEIRVDGTGKVSGRGAYVCPDAACVRAAVEEGRLQHALGVPIPAAVLEELRVAAGGGAARPGTN